jgi:trimeric autotransporter adhesin
MKPIRFFLAILLFPVITSAWAAPPFPPPGNLAEQVAALQAQVVALQANLAAETAARVAAEVALQQAIDNEMTARINADNILQGQLNIVAASLTNSVLALDGILTLDTINGYPTVRFNGVNVQVVNGLNDTETINGLGNLIIGYNEVAPPPEGPVAFCSDGRYARQDECEANGYIYTNSLKTGSHNLVVGDYNNYSQYAGIVSGRSNTINGRRAVVLGGHEHIAAGGGSAILGGESNRARGIGTSVSGGFQNVATFEFSSVSGGNTNTASGFASSVSGGWRREALGSNDWVAGGLFEDQ